jgi:predicted DCC family thiol-disulfide oxidoreductase YuxK
LFPDQIEEAKTFGLSLAGGVPEPARPADGAANRLLVWFDGACPLCRREIAFLKRLDQRGAIEFINIGSLAEAQCPLNRGELLSRFHARENGRLVSGSEAFAAMWRAIPLLRPLGLVARLPVVKAVLERCYTSFLRFRPALQRLLRAAERP